MSQQALIKTGQEVFSVLDTLPESARAEWSRAMYYLYLLVLNKREAGEQAELREVMNEAVIQKRQEFKEVEMTGAQVLINQGKQEGRQEGIQEGRQDGRREGQTELLLDLLETKFGPLSQQARDRVVSLPKDRVTILARKVLTADSLAELEL